MSGNDYRLIARYRESIRAVSRYRKNIRLVGRLPASSQTLVAAPTNLVATAVNGVQIDLSWTDNATTEDGYRIYRGTTSGVLSLVDTIAADSTSYSDTGLSFNTTYYYEVRAFVGITEAASDEASATTTITEWGVDTDIQIWLRGDLGVFQDSGATTPASNNGDPVGYWGDQSGNGLHVTQATTADKPTYRPTAVNSQAAIEFDGISDFLSRAGVSQGMFAGDAATFLIVMIEDNIATDSTVFRYLPTTGNAFGVGATIFSDFFYENDRTDAPASWTNGNYHLLQVDVGPTSTNTTFTLDGAAVATVGAGFLDVTANGALYVAQRGTNSFYLGGSIAEIVLYDRVLTAQEVADFESYINTRYGITIA